MNFSKSGKEYVFTHFVRFKDTTYVTGIQLKYVTILGPVYTVNKKFYRNLVIPNNFDITNIKNIPEYNEILNIVDIATSQQSILLLIIYHVMNSDNIYYKESKLYKIIKQFNISTQTINLIHKIINNINTINTTAEFISLTKDDIIQPYKLYTPIWKRLYLNKILKFINNTNKFKYFNTIESWTFAMNHHIKYQFLNSLDTGKINGGNQSNNMKYSCLNSLEDGCGYIRELENFDDINLKDNFTLTDLSIILFKPTNMSLLQHFSNPDFITSFDKVKHLMYTFSKSIELLVEHGIIYNNENYADIEYTDIIKLYNFENAILSNRHILINPKQLKYIETQLTNILKRNIKIVNNDAFIAAYCLNDMINFNNNLLKLLNTENLLNINNNDKNKSINFINTVNKELFHYLNHVDKPKICKLSQYCKIILDKYFDNIVSIPEITFDKIKLNYFDKLYENNKTEFLINYIKNI